MRSAEHHLREHSLRFALPTASVGRQDAFDPLPSPISLPIKTTFITVGSGRSRVSKLSSPILIADIE